VSTATPVLSLFRPILHVPPDPSPGSGYSMLSFIVRFRHSWRVRLTFPSASFPFRGPMISGVAMPRKKLRGISRPTRGARRNPALQVPSFTPIFWDPPLSVQCLQPSPSTISYPPTTSLILLSLWFGRIHHRPTSQTCQTSIRSHLTTRHSSRTRRVDICITDRVCVISGLSSSSIFHPHLSTSRT
jgi:hypothetical protein